MTNTADRIVKAVYRSGRTSVAPAEFGVFLGYVPASVTAIMDAVAHCVNKGWLWREQRTGFYYTTEAGRNHFRSLEMDEALRL